MGQTQERDGHVDIRLFLFFIFSKFNLAEREPSVYLLVLYF